MGIQISLFEAITNRLVNKHAPLKQKALEAIMLLLWVKNLRQLFASGAG